MRHRKQLSKKALEQQYPNSCWACATRYVNNYCRAASSQGQNYNSDTALAQAVGQPVNGEADIHDILTDHGMSGGQDSEFFPTFQEIQDEIDQGQMLIACTSPTRHGYRSKEPITGGHYVVIVGYDDETNEICVMDPADGTLTWIPYNGTNFFSPARPYWCGTEYTNGRPLS